MQQDKWQSEFKLRSILHPTAHCVLVCISFFICLIIKSNKYICLSSSLSSMLHQINVINLSLLRHCSLQTFFPRCFFLVFFCGHPLNTLQASFCSFCFSLQPSLNKIIHSQDFINHPYFDKWKEAAQSVYNCF